MLVSYALHAGLHGHGLDYLAEAYLGHLPIALKSLTGGGRAALSFAQVPIEEARALRRRARRGDLAALGRR